MIILNQITIMEIDNKNQLKCIQIGNKTLTCLDLSLLKDLKETVNNLI